MDNAQTAARAPERGGNAARVALLLCAVSLLVRGVLWAGVAYSDVPPVYDERAYVMRARGAEVAARRLLRMPVESQLTFRDSLHRAYGGGEWPPLHPLLMATSFLLFGASLGAARAVVALIGAMTTPLVYLLGREVQSERAGLAAGIVHLAYPGFLAFSHLLWSETTYLFFLLLGLLLALRLSVWRDGRRGSVYAVACGAAFGLAALTRVAAFMALVPVLVFIAWRSRPRRGGLLRAALVLGVCLLLFAPWQAALIAKEGRFVIGSTSATGWSIYDQNNPWLGRLHGAELKDRLRRDIDDYAGRHSVSRTAAARALAMRHIAHHPGQFASRVASRFVRLWLPDQFVLRHVHQGAYPPLPRSCLPLLWMFMTAGVLLLLGSAAAGVVLYRGERAVLVLFGALFAAGLLPAVVGAGTSRTALPLFALVTPFCGVGFSALVRAGDTRRRPAHVVAAAAVVLVALNVLLHPGVFGLGAEVTSWYAPIFSAADGLAGTRTRYADRLLVRARSGGDSAPLHLVAELPYAFADGRVDAQPLLTREPTELRLGARGAATPPSVRVQEADGDAAAAICPVRPASWRRWLPLPGSAAEYMWLPPAGRSPRQIIGYLTE